MSVPDPAIFAGLKGNRRIWAIAAIHSDVKRLDLVHDKIAHHFVAGDQLVYLGNYTGRGTTACQAIDSVLLFRRAVIALPGADRNDVVFLRGAQEEMWQKLLQLQFASAPLQVLDWMLAQGVGPTIADYGASVEEGRIAAREGAVPLARWTSKLRELMRARDGHTALMSALRHAAVSESRSLLLVHAGLDPSLSLSAQRDNFWWAGAGFTAIDKPYDGFGRIVRGFDRLHTGPTETPHAVSLDGGCGFGGELVAACFDGDGSIAEMVTSGEGP